MALEAAVYINTLNASNPVGATDTKAQGDDHIRMIKAVLKATFPNITGPVTLNQQDINEARFPAGTKMLFVQTAAPTGWTKDVVHDNKALRIVSGAAGSGGTIDFTTAFSSKTPAGTVGDTALSAAQIPAHTHTFAATSSTESVDHTHTTTSVGTSGAAGAHDHDITPNGTWALGNLTGNVTGTDFTPGELGGNPKSAAFTAAGNHTHSLSVVGTSGGRSAAHTHTVAGTTGSIGGGAVHTHSFTSVAIDFSVKYVDAIIATKV